MEKSVLFLLQLLSVLDHRKRDQMKRYHN